MRGSRNPFDKDSHRATTGNHGAVGGHYVPYLNCVKGRQGMKVGAQEGDVIAPGGDRKTTSGQPGRLAEI